MTTKERIIDEALTLFSRKGFSGVSVKDIADAVGIKDSSLYKHFKSKKEMYDTIVAGMTKRMDEMSAQISLPATINDNNIDELGKLTEQDLVEITQKAFLFYCRDSYAARFRRMLQKEQEPDNNEADLYRKLFLIDSINYQTELFAGLVEHGYMIEVEPSTIAMNFYAPVFLLINRYDGCDDKIDEALAKIKTHVHEFFRIYFKKGTNL